MSLSDFPALNASLNALTTALLLLGYAFIRTERKRAHILCMSAALLTSTAFLACYLYYHFHAGSVRFTAQGTVRTVYFSILLSHTILAMVVVPMVFMTVIPALRARWDKHRRIARWTLPVWLYVSFTGVIIYFMLYQWYPPTPAQ